MVPDYPNIHVSSAMIISIGLIDWGIPYLQDTQLLRGRS